MKVEWDNAYSVGNEEIDNEHKIFIKLISHFAVMSKEKNSYQLSLLQNWPRIFINIKY